MRKLIVALIVTSALIFGMTASNAGAASSSPPASCEGHVTSEQAAFGLLKGGVVADYLHSVGAKFFADETVSTAHCHASA
jgi:hypothetical protein